MPTAAHPVWDECRQKTPDGAACGTGASPAGRGVFTSLVYNRGVIERGQRSIRLSRSYRAIYEIHEDGVSELVSVEEVSKHDD